MLLSCYTQFSGYRYNTIIIIELCNKHVGQSAVVDITLDFGSGILNPRTHHGAWAMEPSPSILRSCDGKEKGIALW